MGAGRPHAEHRAGGIGDDRRRGCRRARRGGCRRPSPPSRRPRRPRRPTRRWSTPVASGRAAASRSRPRRSRAAGRCSTASPRRAGRPCPRPSRTRRHKTSLPCLGPPARYRPSRVRRARTRRARSRWHLRRRPGAVSAPPCGRWVALHDRSPGRWLVLRRRTSPCASDVDRHPSPAERVGTIVAIARRRDATVARPVGVDWTLVPRRGRFWGASRDDGQPVLTAEWVDCRPDVRGRADPR